MLRTAARGVLGRVGVARSICSSSSAWQQTTEESKEVRGPELGCAPPMAAPGPGVGPPPSSRHRPALLGRGFAQCATVPRSCARRCLLAPQEFLKRFAPHAGNLNPPEFPSNFLVSGGRFDRPCLPLLPG